MTRDRYGELIDPKHEYVSPVKKPDPFSSSAWITSDCNVKTCREGYISVLGYDGYDVAYRCPRCDRWDAPAVPRYQGAVDLYTPGEMEQRRKEREEIVFDSRKRREMKTTLVAATGGPF